MIDFILLLMAFSVIAGYVLVGVLIFLSCVFVIYWFRIGRHYKSIKAQLEAVKKENKQYLQLWQNEELLHDTTKIILHSEKRKRTATFRELVSEKHKAIVKQEETKHCFGNIRRELLNATLTPAKLRQYRKNLIGN